MAKKIFAVVVIGCALAIIKVLPTPKSTRHEPRPKGVNSAEVADEVPGSSQDRNVESKAVPSIDSAIISIVRSTVSTSGEAKSVSSSKSVERWKLIMKENRLPLISSGSLRLTEAVVALLELSPEQAHAVNLVIEKFLDRLRAEETAHAYVSVDKDGNEQVVVRPFDRSKFIEAFRNELQTAGGAEVARFIADRSTSNSTLAAGNGEMRAYVEKLPDGNVREVFARTLEAPVVTNSGRDLPPRARLISRGSVGTETRIRHLFAAMDQLPRVVENPASTPGARESNPKK